MMSSRLLMPLFWGATILLVVVGVAMAAFYAPVEETMGPIQKVFYFHMPVAVTTFGAALVVFIASLGFLWQRRSHWDDLAHAGAQVTVLYASIVLLTGMIWAKQAWGYWWTWSPRLTFSLILWLLYVVYLMIRSSIEAPERRALVSAVYGVIAFLDVPLVYFSTKLLPDIHPASIELAPEMRQTLLVWLVATPMLCAGFIAMKYRLLRMTAAAEPQAEAEAAPGAMPAGEQS
ncbi:MAG: cytochrome c biogenesis protein [Phycisphaerales bacterium JB039]